MQLELSQAAKFALQLAKQEAIRCGHEYLGTEHMIIGLLKYPTAASRILRRFSTWPLDVIRAARETIHETGLPVLATPMTPRMSSVLALAQKEATALKQDAVGTYHLLLAAVLESEGIAGQVLGRFHINEASVRMMAAFIGQDALNVADEEFASSAYVIELASL